jgi:hypothetical protein
MSLKMTSSSSQVYLLCYEYVMYIPMYLHCVGGYSIMALAGLLSTKKSEHRQNSGMNDLATILDGCENIIGPRKQNRAISQFKTELILKVRKQ